MQEAALHAAADRGRCSRSSASQFIGFEWPDTDAPARYRARFPGDPGQTDLDQWHRFEQDRPDTFVLMYQFWVRKPA